jgi:hypothetical protein
MRTTCGRFCLAGRRKRIHLQPLMSFPSSDFPLPRQVYVKTIVSGGSAERDGVYTPQPILAFFPRKHRRLNLSLPPPSSLPSSSRRAMKLRRRGFFHYELHRRPLMHSAVASHPPLCIPFAVISRHTDDITLRANLLAVPYFHPFFRPRARGRCDLRGRRQGRDWGARQRPPLSSPRA